jgi:two-component system sensor kinase FixL
LSRLDKGFSLALPVLTGIVALAIFILDTVTHFEIDVPVLYVAVVLLAVRFLKARGVMFVTGACIALAILSDLLTRHGEYSSPALINLSIAMFAIVITSYLALQNEAAHKAIREQAQLLDLTHDTIFVRDMTDKITFWNRGAEELYGWTKDEALGKSTHELLQTRFPTTYKEVMGTLTRKGRWEGDLPHTKKDGMQVLVASRWSLLRDKRGEPIAILETNNDITKQRKTEQNLHDMQVALAHVARITTLGELTASIAHEVNQPLAAIVTNGETCLRLLNSERPDLQEARNALDDIVSNGMRASGIIQRLRALSKKADARKVPLDANDVIREIIPLVQRELSARGISLELTLAPGIAQVLGDRVQLQQVILNLVLNGMDAIMAAGGGSRQLRISTREDSGQVLVAVQDTGIGIDPNAEEQLFNAFFTTKPEGMGMGLAICRSIIEAHGGRIWATKNDDGGATFQFSLPAQRGAPDT